jgi:SpoVK/Ycf46/Vps4 family AAA+-type ATPase
MTITLDDMKGAIENKTAKSSINIPIDEAGLSLALAELNALDGLDEIKRDVNNMVDLVRYYREEGVEPKSKFRMNLILSGNPGTGKTTVARLIGRIYKSLGLLERGHVVETDSSGLLANYVGQTATKTHALIDSALDGVLYIDEAYMLAQRSQSGFEAEALAALVKRMEDDRGRFAVLISGYTDPMRQMLETNEGLQSRFDRTLSFNDYTPEQLTNFTLKTLTKNGIIPNDDAKIAIASYFKTRVKEKDARTFGNMREARNAAEAIIQKHDLRLSRIAKADRTPEIKNTVTIEDTAGLGGDRPKAMKKSLGFG